MPFWGPPNIEKLKDRRDVKGLIKALGYAKDPRIRLEAAGSLEVLCQHPESEHQIADPRASDQFASLLAASLHDPEARVRTVAARLLGVLAAAVDDQTRLSTIVEALVEACSDADEAAHSAAAAALARIGADALPLTLQSQALRAAATAPECLIQALAGTGEPAMALLVGALGSPEAAVSEAAERILSALGPPAVQPLALLLNEGPPDASVRAARALGSIGDGRAAPALLSALHSQAPALREAAALALRRLSDAIRAAGLPGEWPDRVADALAALLSDPNQDVARAAAYALEEQVTDRTGPKLAEYWVAHRQSLSCVAIGPPAVPALIAGLRHANAFERGLTATILGKIRDPRTIRPLLALLKDPAASVRGRAAAALATSDDRRVQCALAAHWVAAHDWDQAVTFGTASIAPLASALADQRAEVRAGAADALARIGRRWGSQMPPAEAVIPIADALCPILTDSCEPVRQAAVQALASMGTTLPIGEVRERIRTSLVPLLDDTADSVQEAAANGLRLLGYTGDPAVLVRAAIILQDWDAVLTCGEAAAIPLSAALHDRRKGVPVAAIKTLGRLLPGLSPGPARTHVFDALAEYIRSADLRLQTEATRMLSSLTSNDAVEPLLVALASSYYPIRQDAAEALANLYRSGRLDQAQRQRILDNRDRIGQRHIDRISLHVDINYDWKSSDCHYDTEFHEDGVEGVDFVV